MSESAQRAALAEIRKGVKDLSSDFYCRVRSAQRGQLPGEFRGAPIHEWLEHKSRLACCLNRAGS